MPAPTSAPAPGPTAARLAGCAGVWLAALAATWALSPYLGRVNFVFFWMAVLFAAWTGGFAAALVCAVLSVASVQMIFARSEGWAIHMDDVLALGTFLLAAGMVSMLAARRADAQRRAAAAERALTRANRELEESNVQLADQQVELEQQVEMAQTLATELEAANEQLEHALAEAAISAQRVASVLNTLSDAVVAYDADWRVLFLNRAARETVRELGADPGEVLGEVIWEVFPFLLGSRFEVDTRRAVAEGRAIEYEEYLPQLDRWLENRIIPSPDGTVTTYSRDITQRHRALAAIKASEARYRALVEASTLMVWHTTRDGLVEDMPFWRELTGQTLDEVRDHGWTRAIHAADQARVVDTWWRAWERQAPYESEYRLRMRDGSVRWFRARAVPVKDAAGDVMEWVGVFNDVDAERRAAAGRTLLERTSKVLEQADQVETTMQRVARLAVTPAPPAGGIPADPFADGASIHLLRGSRLECVSVESRDHVRRALAVALEGAYPARMDAPGGPGRVVRTGRPELVEGFEPLRIAADPEHLQRLRALDIYSALVVPVRVRGEILGSVAFVLHGPERRRPYNEADLAVAEELARRAGVALDNAARVAEAEAERARAEAANRAKSDFLASMSHELRTPLNAIAGYAELLEIGIHGPVTPDQLEAIGRIQRAQRVLLRLINDVLNLARLEAGAVEYDLGPVPLDAVLAEVESLVAPQVRARGLHFEAGLTGEAPPVAWADRDKVQQILLNLLSNAVKFTEPGGLVRVEGAARGEMIALSVEDTGRGIPKDKLDAIFEPFVQVEQGYTRSNEGTGLGLAISRDLARAMRGDVTVESVAGKGSTFVLTLPRAADTQV